jgi:diacylglycerol kinase family enzyme
MRRPPALVLVNPGARGGKGSERLARVWPEVVARFEARAVGLDTAGRWRSEVRDALDGGVRHFVAAGGDGTVGALADALWRARDRAPLPALTLGAIGLGSSNDFHKPVRSWAAGVPVRLDGGRWRDVGRVSWVDETGAERERAFLVSCSLGVTAAANAFFNAGDALLRLMRRRWTAGGIAYAALHEIVRGGGASLDLVWPGARERVRATSLSVLKTPHLAGGLEFDTPVRSDDGSLAVNLIEDRGRLATLAMLLSLARGRFLGRPGARHWSLPGIVVEAGAPVPLEIDGEVVLASRVRFEVLSERIRACA